MNIVVNSSPLIALGAINKLHLLGDIFEEIFIPEEVFRETVINGKNALIGDFLEKAGLLPQKADNQMAVDFLAEFLDRGESEVIVLAKELDIPIVLMDDLRGRRIAEKQKLKVVGSVGILLIAKKRGLLPSITDCIDQMRNKNIYISERLRSIVLKEAGE